MTRKGGGNDGTGCGNDETRWWERRQDVRQPQAPNVRPLEFALPVERNRPAQATSAEAPLPQRLHRHPMTRPLALLALAWASAIFTPSALAQAIDDGTARTAGTATETAGGAIRLRQPASIATTQVLYAPAAAPAPYVPSEFEQYVQQQAGTQTQVRRFGADLVTDPTVTSSGLDPLPSVPADYVIKPGDEVALTLWGSVDADLRLVVDRAGRIAVPRVGAIQVAGLRHADLADAISHRVAQVFKNFQLTATLGQLRAVRVFVTGYAQRPGSLTVSSLASVLHVVMRAGGPSSAGSFRNIQLRRAGKEVAQFDLYELLLKGDRKADQIIQSDDVIHIGPVGTQVGVIGSVNQQAIFELKPNEALGDLLQMAGGFNAVADRSRVAIERLADRATGRVAEVALPTQQGTALGTGDLVRVFSAINAVLPKDKQRKRVRVEGEVAHPGDYILPAGSTTADAVAAAGGLSPAAFLFGTEFSRESVRQTQQENYDRALRDLETDMAKGQASRRAGTAEEVNSQGASASANARLIERLRLVRPTGRVVLPIAPDATQLPTLALEDGDRLYIPSQGTSVGVFGSVFNAGSFVYSTGRTTEDYLKLAGGPTRGADKDSMFVIRANGSVVSARQSASMWSSNTTFNNTSTLPGDTLFVPEEMNKSTLVQDAKDWTQILYQFGLGVAGIKSLGL